MLKDNNMMENRLRYLIEQALIAYNNGAVIECRDMLEDVVRSIDDFEINTMDYIDKWIENKHPIGEDIV